MTEHTQLRLYQVAEIQVSYHPKLLGGEAYKIRGSGDAYDILMDFWDLTQIEYKEDFFVIYLNRANRVIGIHHHSSGGLAGTVVDTKQILGIALKCNCAGIILAHNHPSGNITPSESDIEITKKIKKACRLLDMSLYDHLIVTANDYYSFADREEI